MTVYIIYMAFIIFVVLLIIIGIYFMLSVNSQRRVRKRINKKVNIINEIIENHMQYENIEEIPDKEIEDMKKMVSHKSGLEAFYISYEDYLQQNKNNDKITEYAGEVVNYKILLNNKIVRYKYRTSYILYLISQFGINTEEVQEFAIESLENDSMYVRNNALRLIRNTGNVKLFLKAIETIIEKNHYYNYRVLVDSIDNFKGDMDLLDKALLENIHKFNNRFKRLTIEHFANGMKDEEEIRLMVLDFLANSEDKEIMILAMRYFGRIIDERAKPYILKNLKSEDWEIRAISAKIISNYKDEYSRSGLLENLKDRNYYVRFNSAFSYIEMDEEESVFKELDSITDNFAKDILVYAMYLKSMINHEEYLERLKDTEGRLVTNVS